jgi:hypothetical protein
MTKAELIEAMEGMPDDMPVMYDSCDDWGSWYEVDAINTKECDLVRYETHVDFYPANTCRKRDNVTIIKVILLG